MPVNRISLREGDEPFRGIYGGRPANDETSNMTWLKTRICARETEHVKRHDVRASADGVVQTKHILRLIICLMTFDDGTYWSTACCAGKGM